MKKLFVLLCVITSFVSCDYIHFPVQDVAPIDNDTTTDVVYRKVLLEDFTAHKCNYCPGANIVANNLIQTHGDRVIVVAEHVSDLAKPNSSGVNYIAEFRTTAGSTYNTFFGFPQYPNGMINRKNYSATSNSHIIAKDDWAYHTSIELAKPANAKIEINNSYNSATQQLTCDIKSTFLNDTLTGGPYSLIVMLTQDSIIATQKDGSLTIPNYVHRHVLRDNLNGTWGEVISSAPVSKNTPITKTYSYTLKTSYPTGTAGIHETNCNPNHCHIVAFLYNDATKEVIQVEEKAVTH